MSLLAVVITAKDVASLDKRISAALQFPIDIIELRFDCFIDIDLEKIRQLKQRFSLPMIFSVRSTDGGGNYCGSESQRLSLIEKLFEANPDYFDLEYNTPSDFFDKISEKNPSVKLICSYYNLEKTPKNLNEILSANKRRNIHLYKFVTKVNSSLDLLRMMLFVWENRGSVAGNCLGELGLPMQVAAKILGSAINYINQEATDNQDVNDNVVMLAKLFDIYNYASINHKTKIFSWLGGDMSQSIGHIFHNVEFRKKRHNAVYVKIQLHEFELVDFFKLAKQLPFSGFSVTMPLKEKIIPFLDILSEDSQRIGAVNTILFRKNKLHGFNTDSIGALDAIEEKIKVAGKRVVILGAGGAAKAIAFEAIKRNAIVTILNGVSVAAEQLAKRLSCFGFGFEHINELYEEGYDILINATPVGMRGINQTLPIPAAKILPTCTVMDVVNKPMTPFIQAAMRNSLQRICITGYEMYVRQALAQQDIWFN